MGINVQDVLSQDPEFLRKQLALREMQAVNPTNDPFATIGYTLGRGVSNISQGRGFFDVADPALQRVSQIKQIQMNAMQQAEGDPIKAMEFMVQGLSSDPNLAPFAFQVQDRLNKERGVQLDRKIAEGRYQLALDEAENRKYTSNPELLLQEGLALPEDDPKRQALLTRYSRIAEDRNFSTAKRNNDLIQAQAELERTQAETARIRAQAAKEGQAGIVGKAGSVGQSGAYRDINGQIYGSSEMKGIRQEYEALDKMLFQLNRITDQDIRQAESAFDYVEGVVPKALAGKIDPKTLSAQTKIAATQLLQQIETLPPGAASDADMRAAAKAFPGYGNAEALRGWVNDTKQLIDRYHSRIADQFGFERKTTSTGALTGKTGAKAATASGSTGGDWKLLGAE